MFKKHESSPLLHNILSKLSPNPNPKSEPKEGLCLRITKCEETPEKQKLNFIKEEEEETCERQKEDAISLGLIESALSSGKKLREFSEDSHKSGSEQSSPDSVGSEARDMVASQLRLRVSQFKPPSEELELKQGSDGASSVSEHSNEDCILLRDRRFSQAPATIPMFSLLGSGS